MRKIKRRKTESMCSKEEVRSEIQKCLADNNIVRDKLWEQRNKIMIQQMDFTMEEKLNTQRDMKKDLENIKEDLKENREEHKVLMAKIDEINVKISDFSNVKNLVYGAVKIILVAVGLAILGMVIIKFN